MTAKTAAERTKTKGFKNQSLERALQILGSFTSEHRSATLTEIVRLVKIPKSTSLRLCTTLVEYGFLQIDEETKQYSPGLALFELGRLVVESFSLGKLASRHMDRIQDVVGNTVFIDILRDDHLMHVDKRENTSSPIHFVLQLGRKMPPYFGAPGYLLMAYLPDGDVDRLLEKFPLTKLTKKTITDNQAFKERLRVIRSQGYVVEEGEIVEAIGAASAPIRNRTGNVIAALSVGYLHHTVDSDESLRILQETIKTAREISHSLGYIDET